MSEPSRPDPDALIAALAKDAEHGGRGALKIFLGAAPGVGKTWKMLSQARARLQSGVDVLAGIIETHGRAETEAQQTGIPLLPRREIAYRGQTLHEFDLDAALARRPALLLVDELAHTNAPGSRHAKRWEDVAELLAAGIPVWATLNVQHLESLNDDVARITGVRVTETLPDHVLAMAQDIELVDIPPEALLDRMREGRIYARETAKRALEGFFKQGNLAALREIALRRVAEHVDGDVRDWMRQTGVEGPWPVREGLLALIGPDRTSDAVVRHAKRLAEALRAPWTVLHIERGDSLDRARAAMDLAAQLGATVETHAAADLVGSAIGIARAHNATHIVIGRSQIPLWKRLLKRTLSAQLLARAPDFALHVVPLPVAPAIIAPRTRPALNWKGLVGSAALIGGVTIGGVALRGFLPGEAMGMVYLAAIVLTATWWDMRAVLLAAAIAFFAWDFCFLPPLYKITIGSPRDLVAVSVFAIVALLSGSLANGVRMQAQAAQARIDGLRRIVSFGRKLGEPVAETELLAEIARQASGLAGRAVVLDLQDGALHIRASEPAADTMDEGAWAAARWTGMNGKPSGRGSTTLPSTPWRFLPLQTVRDRLGVLGLRWEQTPDDTGNQAAIALADQAATAWERVRLAGEQARAAAFEETSKLRTALLASLGHDLRTPLTGIQGAAGTLRDAWDKLSTETRDDLLSCIDEDVKRMARFLSNITELTRLECGQIVPRVTRVGMAALIDAAVARLPDRPLIAITMEDDGSTAIADAALLEQVLINVLENSIKYAPQGSLIRIGVTQEESNIAIEVTDEGIGIPADDLPHVFDSFYRARHGDRVAAGTGLGLAIAKGMIDALGGSIQINSPRPGAAADSLPGTIVKIKIPVA